MCELLEAKGIKICAVSLPAKISGVQATIDTTDDTRLPVTVVNANHPGDRQRFTIAHELGHMYLDARRDLDAEVACQRFAGAFMVPAEILRREVGSSRRTITVRELFGLKRLFGVSAQTLAYRAKDLSILSQAVAASIFRLFSSRGWRTQEPLEWPRERPARFERLCFRALTEGLISESKASELLQKTVMEVVQSMDEPPDESIDGRSAGF